MRELTDIIAIRVDKDTNDKVHESAKKHGLNLSEFVRLLLLNYLGENSEIFDSQDNCNGEEIETR